MLLLQDGIPISYWIGLPTAYYMPLPQGLSEVQMIRGGSSLLYGPNPAPAINLVSKRPAANQPFGTYSENVVGSDGLFSTLNTMQGSAGRLSMRLNLAYTESDGQRDNGASRQCQADLYLGYRPNDAILWYIDLHDYDASSGDPGKLNYSQFLYNPNQAPTPFNHNWVRRTSVTLGNESNLGNDWLIQGKFWATWQELAQRSAAAGAAPASTTLVDEDFHSQGLDLRFAKKWGKGNALTFGTVLYHDDAPFRQWTSTAIIAPRDFHGGTQRLDQARDAWYGAVFAENVFRLPHHWHVVASVRIEREKIRISETVRPPNLVRPLIDQPQLGLPAPGRTIRVGVKIV